jgi:hypothetical protein
MMRCENCSHECTVVDFVTLRNLCEHLYLDSLARKHHPYWFSPALAEHSGRDVLDVLPGTLGPEEHVAMR